MPAVAPAMQAPTESGLMVDEVQGRQRVQKMAPLKTQSKLRAKPSASVDRVIGSMAEEEAASALPETKERLVGESAPKDQDMSDQSESNQLLKEIYALLEVGRIDRAKEKLLQYTKQYPKMPIPADLKSLLKGDQ